MKSGIYKIYNLVNGKYYYGSTENFKERKTNHFSSLGRNVHENSRLQNSYNKHGKKNFLFEIIERIPKNKLAEIEQQYLDKYWDNGVKCYNIKRYCRDMSGPNHPRYGTKTTQEVKDKISKANKEYYKNNPPPMLGKKHKQKSKNKISKANKGKLAGEKNPRFGKKMLTHVAEAIRNATVGRKWSEEEKKKVLSSRKASYEKRNPNFKLLTEDFLKEQIIDKQVSVRKLAKQLKMSKSPIRKKMKEYNIKNPNMEKYKSKQNKGK